jgi:branched-chain amino acid transport system permease protein
VTYALVSRVVDPSYAAISINVSLLTLAVVGGLGTRLGPVLGAFLVVLAPQLLTKLRQYELLAYGLGLLAFLIFVPRGVAGLFEASVAASDAITPQDGRPELDIAWGPRDVLKGGR